MRRALAAAIRVLPVIVVAGCCSPEVASTLPVAMRAQETSMWCWAASGEMTMEYLGAPDIRQCDEANKRFGPYLPEWMFTRAMFAIAFGALILLIVLPGLVSTFLLIAGALLIVFGAITYSDPMLASRWLPGRTTPTHALLFGVAVLMMGVLLGVLAK